MMSGMCVSVWCSDCVDSVRLLCRLWVIIYVVGFDDVMDIVEVMLNDVMMLCMCWCSVWSL